MDKISKEEIDKLYLSWSRTNQKHGYFFNQDLDFTRSILEGLLVNKSRYGYMSCPCRLALGVRKRDLDMICPCDYRDQDLLEYGNCFCGLFVSKKVNDNKISIKSIPERRPVEAERKAMEQNNSINSNEFNKKEYPLWRCRVCGYLCARESAPDVCPICGAEHDRFEEYLLK